MQTTDFEPSSAPTGQVAAPADRRRPGRRPVSPELIPLLRRQAGDAEAEVPVQFGDPDQLGPARGIGVGVLLAVPLWVGLAYLGRWILS